MRMIWTLALISAVIISSFCGCRAVEPHAHTFSDPAADKAALVERLLAVSHEEVLREESIGVRRFLEGEAKDASGGDIDAALKPVNDAIRKKTAQELAKDFTSEELQRLIEVYTDPVIRKYWGLWPFYQVKCRDWRHEFLYENPEINKRIWKLSFPNEEPPDVLFMKPKPNKPTGGDVQ